MTDSPTGRTQRPSSPAGRAEPKADRPAMSPDYGLLDAASGSGLLPWSWVEERMSRSRNYWIGTTRPDGRPHVMPVWGIWLDGTFYFGTSRRAQKARNLAQSPELVVHLESGDEAVILEGVAEEVTDLGVLTRYADAYQAKYQFRPDPNDAAGLTLALRPRVAFAWLESDFVGSATRWRFAAG